MISALFNCMHRDSILHIVNNFDARLITSWLLRWPMDRHTAYAKNNNKYKLAVRMVNVLDKLWLLNWLSRWSMYLVDQCTKYATLTTNAEKLIRHGKGDYAPVYSPLN
jgi:hypothetical protein